MANIITGKIWSLDTVAGVVTTGDVCIHSIIVRFTTAGSGSCIITGFNPSTTSTNSAVEVLLDLKTTAASTAAVFILDKQYLMGDQTFKGLVKSILVNVDTIYVITGNGA